MHERDVVELLGLLDRCGLVCWVDGGWGVDALLGHQSRQHSDLDLVIDAEHLPAVQDLLTREGFVVIRDWLPTAVAYRDAKGREVDLHPVERTADGGGVQVLLNGERYHYSAPVAGVIGGRAVRCCPVNDQVCQHLGYEPDEHDRADICCAGRAIQRPAAAPLRLTGGG